MLLYNPAYKYWAFVDMSGGSKDDAVLCIGHLEDGTIVIDLIEKQAGKPPFNPRDAVRKFIGILPDYHIKSLWGDNYAAETFKSDWRDAGLRYTVCPRVQPSFTKRLSRYSTPAKSSCRTSLSYKSKRFVS